jgi:hypothetical protein
MSEELLIRARGNTGRENKNRTRSETVGASGMEDDAVVHGCTTLLRPVVWSRLAGNWKVAGSIPGSN